MLLRVYVFPPSLIGRAAIPIAVRTCGGSFLAVNDNSLRLGSMRGDSQLETTMFEKDDMVLESTEAWVVAGSRLRKSDCRKPRIAYSCADSAACFEDVTLACDVV